MTTPFVRPEATATITVPEMVIDVPAHDETIYSYGFESGMDLWSTGTVSTVRARTGTYSLLANGPARAFTGLVVGHQYTLQGYWYWDEPGREGWTQYTQTFTAVATAQSKTLGLNGHWDDVTLVHHVPATYTLTPELTITQGKIALDENYSPYVMGRVTVPMTSEEVLEQIDPRNNQRITVTAAEAVSGVSRTYDLQLRSRSADHKAQTIDLELASDELMLHDRVNVSTSVDSSPRQYESSLRAVCNWALGKVQSVVRNLITTPRGTSTVGWIPSLGGTSSATLTSPTTPGMNVGGLGIDTFLRVEATTTGTYIDLRTPTLQGILTGAGASVTASAWVRPSSIPGVTGSAYVQFYNVGNGLVGTATSAPFALSSGNWTRIHMTGQVPAGAVRAVAVFRAFGSVAVGSRLDATAFLLEESPRLNPFKELVLVSDTTDADVSARWSLQNQVLNPNGVSSGAAWLTAGGSTVSNNASGGRSTNDPYYVMTSTGSTQMFMVLPQKISAKKGDMFTVSMYMHRANAQPAIDGLIRVYEMDNASSVMRQMESTRKVIPSSGAAYPFTWDRHTYTFVVQNPNTVRLEFYASAFPAAAGRSVGVDDVLIVEGAQNPDFFSGSTAPTGYVTNWTGATAPLANNSVSERRPADGVERLPELFDWKPGQSLFDFLQPLLNASGLRLFCDENRVWRLVDPNEYEVPGYVVAQAKHNTTEGEDLITRNEDTWADAVVVTYSWTGEGGESKTAYDVAGDPNGKAVVRELDREYPGPGAAQHILNSLQGRGRTQTVTVLGQYGATPGQDATISLPGTYTQTGKVRRVTFDLSSGLMDVETRGLTDALPGSWAVWNPTQKWVDVTPTLKWKDA